MNVKFRPTHKWILGCSNYPVINHDAEQMFKKRIIAITGKGSDGKKMTGDVLKMIMGE